MGFWFFMTICNLILPVLMIVLGKVFVKNPPRLSTPLSAIVHPVP